MPSGRRGYFAAIWSLVLFVGMAGAHAATAMELKSSSIPADTLIAPRYVYDQCDGDNVSPGFTWSGAPSDTKSFALTMHDPDAPAAGGWWHWIVLDIPADVRHIDEGASGSLPAPIVEERNDFRRKGYGGPCPPKGADPHRYVFTIYALDEAALSLGMNASPATIDDTLKAHALAKASLVARYGR